MIEIIELRKKLERKKGQKIQIEDSLQDVRTKIRKNKQSLILHEKAREIVRIVGLKTQQQLQFHISNITSLALEAVFDNPYELMVEFVQRRNKTECDLYFKRNGSRVDPLTASGIGAVDVAAFALRIACWSMEQPKTRNTILLDEPFKHLKGKKENKKVLEMIKEVSNKLGIQIIMVSDERIPREDTIEATDKLFEVKIKNGISNIITE